MNEFIVWDKEKNIFVPQGEIIFSFYGDTRVTITPNCIEYIGDSCHNDYDENRFKILKDIGLKDINGKSIYADCSIIEFEWGQDRHNIIGYFKYNQEYLSYEIIMMNAQIGKSMCYAPHNCFNFKIIDTIQENKLGLIK